ncbi:MAG: tRNA 2-thiouridine(34) synthase MnmA [Gammaproteobacteria bacterium]|nr:tRNA 2-thiouridine(34) synthase MnmA [Gammaproteobacteria bacterium]
MDRETPGIDRACADIGPAQCPANRIVVGLSGGVDSAVALMLLKREHPRIEALFMKNWEEDDDAEYCSASQDLADAERICAHLDVPLRTVNFSYEYWQDVFAHFLAEHRRGRTPNPDLLCNKEIKFKAFHEYAQDLGFDTVATGHYARLGYEDGEYRLLKGADPAKDQSYFLALLDQTQLARACFPIGHLRKQALRDLARAHALPVHDKRDSTGICFIGERPFRDFLARYMRKTPGPIRNVDDDCQVGEHIGLPYYTIGQRQGLGIGGRAAGSGLPWYVVDKRQADNTLLVAQGGDHPALLDDVLVASRPHWIASRAPTLPLRCSARIRYRQPDQACVVEHLQDSNENSDESAALRVRFDRPQRAITPGQAVVFYQGDTCLGAATIEQAGARAAESIRPAMAARPA